MNADDEIRILNDGWRLLGDEVGTVLLSRGWAVADLDVGDDEPLEFYWPPTAPIGYDSHAGPPNEAERERPLMRGQQRTPWLRPTRISWSGSSWKVRYGEAIAQPPDPPLAHHGDAALLADVESIEWWPMTVDEARRIQIERVYATTVADARDDHSQAAVPTEPYAGRIKAIREHEHFEQARTHGLADADPPSTPRPRGDLRAQVRLVDAEAWASAVRTARAGGDG
ncbi:hypothetical protein ACSDQ9_00795 [Aestuariimicrobium soli]|uniref:hypothetical protein n=1 Tax=Aestuariimicrobium soli TaxID=2035834 RepID=UPI003EC07329